jgi:hypothetical protein
MKFLLPLLLLNEVGLVEVTRKWVERKACPLSITTNNSNNNSSRGFKDIPRIQEYIILEHITWIPTIT